jgi:hypothetical protein
MGLMTFPGGIKVDHPMFRSSLDKRPADEP